MNLIDVMGCFKFGIVLQAVVALGCAFLLAQRAAAGVVPLFRAVRAGCLCRGTFCFNVTELQAFPALEECGEVFCMYSLVVHADAPHVYYFAPYGGLGDKDGVVQFRVTVISLECKPQVIAVNSEGSQLFILAADDVDQLFRWRVQ